MKILASKKIYDEAIGQVENWCKFLSFLAIKLAPLAGTLSLVIPSFYFYIFTDLGSNSFMLPVPMW